MKRIAMIGACAVAVALALTGCDWSTGSDATSWSSAYNWVNFSGTYRGVGGGLLVTDYSTTPTLPGVTNIYNASQSGGTLPARGTTASGRVANGSIVPGSFMVRVGTMATLSDPGKAGVLTGNGTGTVNYEGGTWSVQLDIWSPDPQPITISYSYTVTRDGTASSGARPGSTRVSIYSFNVTHSGQNLTIVDNNGSTYSGRISQLRSTSGAENTDIDQVANGRQAKVTYYESTLPENGDSIMATFECIGVSAAMMQVKIVGTLQGEVAAGVFTSRRMDGTWVELGGKTGDINASTAEVAITVPAAEEVVEVEDTGTGT